MKGFLNFIHRNGLDNSRFYMFMENILWYSQEWYQEVPVHMEQRIRSKRWEVVRKLSKVVEYELWHQRLGHPGKRVMSQIHKSVKGDPKLKGNYFYKCASYFYWKLCERNTDEKYSRVLCNEEDESVSYPPDQKGKHFSMDLEFVRGSDFSEKTSEGKTITSIDGYNSYLIIVDKSSRNMFTFLTKSKHPPIDIVRSFLACHGHPDTVGKPFEIIKRMNWKNLLLLEVLSITLTII